MRFSPILLVLAPSLLLLAGCSGSEDGDDSPEVFVLKNTPHGVASSTPLLANGDLLAYLASEASSGAQDFNGDGDMIDPIAVRVNTASNSKHQLGVATQSMAFLNRTLFLVVSEASDGKNWNGDGDSTDLVLLFVEKAATSATFFAELDAGASTPMAVVGERLLYVSATAPGAEFDTNLLSTAVSTKGEAPDAPTAVLSTIDDVNDDGVSLSIWKVADGMVFLTMDETVDGELNGDGDALDTDVLALIDAGDIAAVVTTTGLAVDPTGPVEAVKNAGDWTVAFLVNEDDQGVNLNDPALFDAAWQPGNCNLKDDTDRDDDVLHWLLYSELIASNAVVNTGLVGRVIASEFVYVLVAGTKTYVGVVSRELDEGVGTGCDLNGDGDFVDRIFRWVKATNPLAPALPVVDQAKLLALADNVPGYNGDSTGGVVTVGPLWVLMVDEEADGRNHDGDPDDHLLLGAHNPNNVGQNWNFDHGTSSPGPITVTWMARNARTSDAFVAALSEASLGVDLNGDGDMLDSVPTFPERHVDSVLKFPGVEIAAASEDAGIVTGAGVGFIRLSEDEHGETDLNGDGDTNDFMLVRVALGGGNPALMGTLNTLSGPAVSVKPDGEVRFGAFLFQENLVGNQGKDLNKDGDADDLVVRYFRFP